MIWADGGCNAWQVDAAVAKVPLLRIEIVKRGDDMKGFVVLPRRWVVERTFAWIVRCRRLNHDYERLPEHSDAMIKWAMIGLMTRRISPTPGRRPGQPSTNH